MRPAWVLFVMMMCSSAALLLLIKRSTIREVLCKILVRDGKKTGRYNNVVGVAVCADRCRRCNVQQTRTRSDAVMRGGVSVRQAVGAVAGRIFFFCELNSQQVVECCVVMWLPVAC